MQQQGNQQGELFNIRQLCFLGNSGNCFLLGLSQHDYAGQLMWNLCAKRQQTMGYLLMAPHSCHVFWRWWPYRPSSFATSSVFIFFVACMSVSWGACSVHFPFYFLTLFIALIDGWSRQHLKKFNHWLHQLEDFFYYHVNFYDEKANHTWVLLLLIGYDLVVVLQVFLLPPCYVCSSHAHEGLEVPLFMHAFVNVKY